jgi:translation initiation factor 1
MSNSRLVYSTDDGDRRKNAGGDSPAAKPDPRPGDGVVRVGREKTGRRGKTVTLVHDLPAGRLSAIASDLKRYCGAGGSVKQGTIELQGEHREKVAARLRSEGYEVKLIGG